MTIHSGAGTNAGDVQRVANPDLAWEREKSRAHSIKARNLAALRELHADGGRINGEVRRILTHHDIRKSAALKALGRNARRDRAIHLANEFDAWRTHYPPVHWYKQRKAKGGYRPICRLPLELKAVHQLIADILSALFQPAPHMFGVTGKSRDAAARALKASQREGYVYSVKLDVVDCFQSIDPERLIQFPFPLPKEVIRRALDTRHMMFEEMEPRNVTTTNLFRSGYPTPDQRTSGPQGLVQGSPASSIILAWLLNQITLPGDVRLFIFADNLAVSARDDTTCRAAVDMLIEYFLRDCPTGPLALCPPEFAGPGTDPFTFLSYEFDLANDEIGISPDAFNKLEWCLSAIEEMEFSEDLHQAIAMWQVFRSFGDGFPAANIGRLLEPYVEMSAVRFDCLAEPYLADLHRHVFDPPTTMAGSIIKALCASREPVALRGRRNCR